MSMEEDTKECRDWTKDTDIRANNAHPLAVHVILLYLEAEVATLDKVWIRP